MYVLMSRPPEPPPVRPPARPFGPRSCGALYRPARPNRQQPPQGRSRRRNSRKMKRYPGYLTILRELHRQEPPQGGPRGVCFNVPPARAAARPPARSPVRAPLMRRTLMSRTPAAASPGTLQAVQLPENGEISRISHNFTGVAPPGAPRISYHFTGVASPGASPGRSTRCMF